MPAASPLLLTAKHGNNVVSSLPEEPNVLAEDLDSPSNMVVGDRKGNLQTPLHPQSTRPQQHGVVGDEGIGHLGGGGGGSARSISREAA